MAVLRVVSRIAIAAAMVASARGFQSEIVSDIMTSGGDETVALQVKNEQFWQPMLDNAEASKLASAYSHLTVYEEAEQVLVELPDENAHVKELLVGALLRLRRADRTVFQQALESGDIASAQLEAGPQEGKGSSFFTGGKIRSYFNEALQSLTGGRYGQRLNSQVQERQASVLPVLRGAAGVTGNVLRDCREASRMSFDALKYDIYNKGVPKTPKAAKDIAYKLVDATSETRHNFMSEITAAAGSIARDSEERATAPAAVVTQALVSAVPVGVAVASGVEF